MKSFLKFVSLNEFSIQSQEFQMARLGAIQYQLFISYFNGCVCRLFFNSNVCLNRACNRGIHLQGDTTHYHRQQAFEVDLSNTDRIAQPMWVCLQAEHERKLCGITCCRNT